MFDFYLQTSTKNESLNRVILKIIAERVDSLKSEICAS
jgi:trehalose/maltose hydrolase-like predicted phosphorylase